MKKLFVVLFFFLTTISVVGQDETTTIRLYDCDGRPVFGVVHPVKVEDRFEQSVWRYTWKLWGADKNQVVKVCAAEFRRTEGYPQERHFWYTVPDWELVWMVNDDTLTVTWTVNRYFEYRIDRFGTLLARVAVRYTTS